MVSLCEAFFVDVVVWVCMNAGVVELFANFALWGERERS